MESLEAFKDTVPTEKKKAEEAVKPAIPKYVPKAYREWFEIGKFDFEVNPCAKVIGIAKGECCLTVGFADVPDLVQFLAWAMRERMEASADGEEDKQQAEGRTV